jgi:hypothetical protein
MIPIGRLATHPIVVLPIGPLGMPRRRLSVLASSKVLIRTSAQLEEIVKITD